jgi:hypothetical protein
MVAVAVGGVLIGTGALGRSLPDSPIAAPAPVLPAVPGAPGPAAPGPADRPPAGTDPAEPTAPPPLVSRPPAAPPDAGPPTAGQTSVPGPIGSAAPEPSPSAPPPGLTSYEAEEAELSGFVSIFPVPDASGGEVVGRIGRQENNHVRFIAVTVPAAGEYFLTLHYVSAPPGEAAVAVNGAEPAPVDFPGLGDWQQVGAVTVPVELAGGANEIWFGQPQGPAPALDRITIEAASDPGAPDPAASDPGPPDPAAGEPAAPEPDAAEPDAAEPGAAEPAAPASASSGRGTSVPPQ